MSSYPVLDDKPIDQWKVTELKEELKRRKLATKGLKDDLIRRLDEALRAEVDGKEEEVHDEDSSDKDEHVTRNDKGNEKGDDDEEAAQDDEGTKKEEVVHSEVDTEKKVAVVIEEDIPKEVVVHKEKDSSKEDDEKAVNEEDISTNKETENGIDCEPEPQVKSEHTEPEPEPEPVGDTPVVLDTKVHDDGETGKLDNDVSMVDANDGAVKVDDAKIQEGESRITIETVEVVTHTSVAAGSVETNIMESRSMVTVSSQNNDEIKVGKEDSISPPEHAELNDSNPNNQVSEVNPSLGFQVKSDSISTDSVSINEKNELKDNLNADNFHIELDNVKPEMVQPSSSDIPHNGGDVHPLDDQEPCENQGSVGEVDDINATNVDLSKKNDSADGGYLEKLNLDRSSGDDSMEEDILESKQVESNHISEEVERSELTKDHVMKEGSPVDGASVGFSPNRKDISTGNNKVAVPAEKRKLEDQEVVRNNEPPKRRRWNTETIKVPDPQSSNLTPLTTPKDAFQPKFSKRNFNRSDSTLSGGDTPKERVVPPSPKPPTTSLKIDRFLRPFTLKAVQELLGKTGTVCSFWMDHIKTHCYVTFSSVEEAVETRNALYNLQWPTNGGRLLVADFVDPQEVKSRAEAPQPPAAPVVNKPVPPSVPSQPQPSPRQIVPKQQLPPPPASLPPPPPPPISDSHTVRERLPLPPPPPITKKPDPPIVTLDDLFKKTRATPRIYYLPLSEEQVAAKVAAQSRNAK